MIFPKYNWNLPDDDISDTYESEDSDENGMVQTEIEETKEDIKESTVKDDINE